MALKFLKKLTGSDTDDYDDFEEDDFYHEPRSRRAHEDIEAVADAGIMDPVWDGESYGSNTEEPEEDAVGELPVDMFETDDAIVIHAFVAGVRPADLDISITRDSVTIQGSRTQETAIMGDDYMHRELFWGSFSRTIPLPDEVIIDEAEAHEHHGLLEITLPRLDKHRTTKLTIKTTK